MANFFDGGPGDDMNFSGLPGAVKTGYMLGYICVFPFLVVCKGAGMLFDHAAAKSQARAQQKIPPPPEPPPWTREQHSPPPSPPPPADPLEKFRIILGVTKDASKEQIQKRYRFCSQLCHPDKVAEHLKAQAEEEFKRLSEAYRVLVAVAPDGPAKPRPQAPRTETATPRPTPKAPEAKRPAEPQHTAKAATPTPAANKQPAQDDNTIKYDEQELTAKLRNFKPKYS